MKGETMFYKISISLFGIFASMSIISLLGVMLHGFGIITLVESMAVGFFLLALLTGIFGGLSLTMAYGEYQDRIND